MKLLQNKYLLIVIAFIIGALSFRFFGPEKIVVKKEIEEKEVIKYKNNIIYKDKIIIVDKVVEKLVSEKKIVRKETFPDGHIIEEEIYESNTQQVERLQQEEKLKYEQKLTELEHEYSKKLSESKTIINPKKFTVSSVLTADVDSFNVYYGAGVSYDIGHVLNVPIVAGGYVTNKPMGIFTLGIRF